MAHPRKRTSSRSLPIITLQEEVVNCSLCARLVAWREQVALEKVKRFAGHDYWGKPVPSFGDPGARLLVVGLAPAAHGANRTGRMFTGDRSGDWLYRALYRAGFANQPASTHCEDGLSLDDCYITAVNHCAPPANKLLPEEIKNCREFLSREMALLTRLRVVVALGKVAFDAVFREMAEPITRPRPKFAHAIEWPLQRDVKLIASFHPSQQNTFTGKLTGPMLDRVFSRARDLIPE